MRSGAWRPACTCTTRCAHTGAAGRAGVGQSRRRAPCFPHRMALPAQACSGAHSGAWVWHRSTPHAPLFVRLYLPGTARFQEGRYCSVGRVEAEATGPKGAVAGAAPAGFGQQNPVTIAWRVYSPSADSRGPNSVTIQCVPVPADATLDPTLNRPPLGSGPLSPLWGRRRPRARDVRLALGASCEAQPPLARSAARLGASFLTWPDRVGDSR